MLRKQNALYNTTQCYSTTMCVLNHKLPEARQSANQEATATSNEPFGVNKYSTELPGRPSIRHLIFQEFERRVSDKLFEKILGKEAVALHEWAKTEHSQAPTPTAGTIENLIRDRHRKAKLSDELITKKSHKIKPQN